MKKLIVMAVMLFLSVTSFSQVKDWAGFKMKHAESVAVKGDMQGNEIVILSGNVGFGDEKFELFKADSVRVNVTRKTISVYGDCQFSFKGRIIKDSKRKKGETARLEYVSGADELVMYTR